MSIIPCYRGGHNCSWPACPADCDGRPGLAALSSTPTETGDGRCPICNAPWNVHLIAGEKCVLIGDEAPGASASVTGGAPPPQPTPGDDWAAIIRNEYDKAPDHYAAGDNWIDGADEIGAKINTAITAARADIVEQIAQLAEERGRLWVKEGVRLAAGQGNPFPKFAAEIREKFKV